MPDGGDGSTDNIERTLRVVMDILKRQLLDGGKLVEAQ
jgi:hypothetical protein